MDSLLALDANDLRTLAGALRSERLSLPGGVEALRRWLPNRTAVAVAADFGRLVEQGFGAPQIATLLDAVAADRAARPEASQVVELVATSPLEGEPGQPRPTSAVVQTMFAAACHSVDIVGYAVHQGRDMFRVLADRMEANQNLRVRMILHVKREYDDESTPAAALLARFLSHFRAEEWPPGVRLPELYYDPRGLDMVGNERASMHAKCVVVDERAVFISSANFTAAAHQRNIELGVRLALPSAARRLTEFLDRLIESRVVIRV